MFHDLDVADVHLDLGEHTTAAVTIDQPGVYEVTCTVPGHATTGIVLTLEVS